jgi:hypothetical protein
VLEPCDGKLSSTVLRGERESNLPTYSTIKQDLPGSDCKTVWFDSRFFRTNILWENNALRITDIHLFDENFPSDYLTEKTESSQYFLYTLPFIDGYTKTDDKIDGLRLKAVVNGKEIEVLGKDPVIDDSEKGKLRISWPLQSFEGTLAIKLEEQKMEIKLESKNSVDWFFDLGIADNAASHLTTIAPQKIDCQFKEMTYSVTAEKGSFSQPGNGIIFRISPDKNSLILDFSRSNHQ